uniref:Uncharacterized protein n=1 Tax=Rhizophora mucronata TaxID=61149 RepID=A0A2P2J128_RHIMU
MHSQGQPYLNLTTNCQRVLCVPL